MGQQNSSITRVLPVFEQLLCIDATGERWLPKLLTLVQGPGITNSISEPVGALDSALLNLDREIPAPLANALEQQLSAELGRVRNCFEKELAPPERFLRWLFEHPNHLTWPSKRVNGQYEPCRFGKPTQEYREGLFSKDDCQWGKSIRAAIADVDAVGATGSKKMWWAFEGFTSVDCYLETERLVLLIEGKRTEGLSPATDWYPQRNQIIRNVEVAAQHAASVGKDFAVLLCAERHIAIGEAELRASLPHLSIPEQDALGRHYLGCVTWERIAKELCGNLHLPNTLKEGVDLSLRSRAGECMKKR